MDNFKCEKCNKMFSRKTNYLYHINNIKKPCFNNSLIETSNDKNNNYKIKDDKHLQNECDDNIELTGANICDLIIKNHDNIIQNKSKKTADLNTCIYCDTVFSRQDSLRRHINERCKSKKYFDELEKLKERLNRMKNENEILKIRADGKQDNEHTKQTTLNITNTNILNKNNNTINKINNGVINNNLNVELVQFGSENIDEIDLDKAIDVYFKSTGGNILSNILKLINFDEDNPKNHNICVSDLSREIVRIFNGIKFVIKKFKDVKGDIMYKIIKNTNKLVDKIEKNDSIVLSEKIFSKFKINNVSLKLLKGIMPEDIVRGEIREKENNNVDTSDIDSDLERDFTLEERLRIEHLERKQQGLIDISLEKVKNELYNGRDLIEQSENIIKQNKKQQLQFKNKKKF